MASTCDVFENNNHLGKEALVPLINSSTICKYNKRREISEQVALLKAEDIERHLQRATEETKQYGVRVNTSTATHMALHACTASTDRKPYDFKREENYVKIVVRNPEWEHEEGDTLEKKSRGALIGKLAEKEILDNVLDTGKVHICYALPYESFVHYCSRETDGFHRIGNKVVAVEVKCLGKLTSYKPRLFNNRLFKMVAKSVITGSGVTFVVIRDDARMNLDKEFLGIVEVHFWEDVSRLLLFEDAKQIKLTHQRNLQYIADKSVADLENHKDGIQFKAKNSKTVRKNTCIAMVPCFKRLNNKTLKKHVVVGPNVPYFDFILKEVFLTYRHKYERSWTTRSEGVYIIANSWEDIADMFKSYKKMSQRLNIKFYVKEPLDRTFSSICGQFTKEDNFEDEQFLTWNDLGTRLYNNKLTHWKQPIPCVLLLLGEGQHVPKLLITARLSFGILVKTGDTYATGINLEEIPFPDKIAVLGTKEECMSGVLIAANSFPGHHIVGFASDNHKYILNRSGDRLCGNYTDLDKELRELQFPMYREFHYAAGVWKAE